MSRYMVERASFFSNPDGVKELLELGWEPFAVIKKTRHPISYLREWLGFRLNGNEPDYTIWFRKPRKGEMGANYEPTY